MINEEKVKIMTKLAMYEQGRGRKHLPVSRYYRSDYIGLALIKNFFLVTITWNLSDYRLCDCSCSVFYSDVYSVFREILSGKEECTGILQPAYRAE